MQKKYIVTVVRIRDWGGLGTGISRNVVYITDTGGCPDVKVRSTYHVNNIPSNCQLHIDTTRVVDAFTGQFQQP